MLQRRFEVACVVVSVCYRVDGVCDDAGGQPGWFSLNVQPSQD